MQVAQRLGGYSLGGADLLRRAMGKKKLEEMVAHRATFAQGAAANGIGEAKANEIFDLMEKFAGYGFNKSHAAAYALLAYHTAWAKVHFAAEFAAANMSVALDDTDKLQDLLRRCAGHGHRLRAAGREPRRLPLRAGRRQAGALRPGRDQGHRAGRDRGDRRGARSGRSVQEPVRLLRPGRPGAHQQARGRGAGQGGRVRRAGAEPRVAAGQHRRSRSTTPTRNSPTPTRAACSTTPSIRMRRRPRSPRSSPPNRGASRNGWAWRSRRSASSCRAICSTRAPTRCGCSPSAASPTCSTAASRSCWPASSATCASSTASAAAWRCSGSTTRPRRSRRWRPRNCCNAHRDVLKDDELVDRAGQGAARSLLRRAAPERAAGLGSGRRALPLRQVSAGRGQRQRPAGGRSPARLSVAARGDRSWRIDAGSHRAPATASRAAPAPISTSATQARFYPTDAALATLARRRACEGRAQRRLRVRAGRGRP